MTRMRWLVGVNIAQLLIFSVGPEGRLVDGVKCILREGIAVVLHGHLVVGQEGLDFADLFLVPGK